MQTFSIKTFTGFYSHEEDRIRLDCIDAQDAKLGIWFTRRLFDRIIPTLAEQVKVEVANKSHVNLQQEIMQLQAKQERLSQAPEIPVRLNSETAMFLCRTVHFKKASNDTTVVIFTNDTTIEANMGLNHTDIRKVLDIFYGIYLKADWSVDIFPSWVSNADQPTETIVKVH